MAAYLISEGGSDWRKAIVLNSETKEILGDTLVDIKFSGLSWKGNDGFYYSSYDKPKGSELSAKTDQHKVYYHKLGTPQEKDELIYGGMPDEKHRYIGASVTEDGQFLQLSAANSTSGNKLFIQNLNDPNGLLVPMVEDEKNDNYIIENVGSKLYIVTDRNAPNTKIVTVDASNPTPEHWVDFIAETANVLTPNTGGGYFFADWKSLEVKLMENYRNHSGAINGNIKNFARHGDFIAELSEQIGSVVPLNTSISSSYYDSVLKQAKGLVAVPESLFTATERLNLHSITWYRYNRYADDGTLITSGVNEVNVAKISKPKKIAEYNEVFSGV